MSAREVRAEFLAPVELEQVVVTAPIVYLPLGSLEFHSSHVPIGLDTLNAHGLCVGAAERTGGIVLPPVYQGLGGGHGDYPWSIMMSSPDGVRSHLEQTLAKLEEFGFRLAVLFTGHFAPEQLDMIDEIAADWNAGEHSLDVLATGINRNEASPIRPDHAGVFETSVLHALHPDLVHLDRLPAAERYPAVDPDGDAYGLHRHDPEHALWGIFGADPRGLDLSATGDLLEVMVQWLSDEVTSRREAVARSS